MKKSTQTAELQARNEQLEKELAELRAREHAASQVSEQEQKPAVFVDFRNNNEYVLRVTGPCEIHMKQYVKWDKDTRGLVLGSWLRMDVFKGLDEAAIWVRAFLVSKNKKGFMYAMKLEGPEEQKNGSSQDVVA